MGNYYEELCNRLKEYTYWSGSSNPGFEVIHPLICDEAIDAINELMKSNIILMNQLKEAKDFIRYLDKKYSYLLPEDNKFDGWR